MASPNSWSVYDAHALAQTRWHRPVPRHLLETCSSSKEILTENIDQSLQPWIARYRSLESTSGKYKRRGNSETTKVPLHGRAQRTSKAQRTSNIYYHWASFGSIRRFINKQLSTFHFIHVDNKHTWCLSLSVLLEIKQSIFQNQSSIILNQEREVQRLLQSWFKTRCIVFYNNISAGHTSLLQVYRLNWCSNHNII